MSEPAQALPIIRFGSYTLDVPAGELHKNGTKIRLPDQPFQILLLLLQRPGEVVTRDELRHHLWSSDTFVDFERGLNSAVKKLRDVLGDSAETPRFVETLPRRGYRFIYPVGEAAPKGRVLPEPPRPRPVAWLLAGLSVLLAGAFVFVVAARRNWLAPKNTGGSIRSIAVLPLENHTGDPQQEYLVDGIHDELITEVAQMGGLKKVISRTSVMQYKGSRKPLPQIARDLNVDGVLEGGVQRAGDRIRVTVQLIAASEDRHVWAQTFERDSRDASLLPAEIASAIAGKLGMQLAPEARVRLGEMKPVNPEVYRAYLQGRYYAGKWTNQDLWQAIRHFQAALDLDPTYAPAWAGIGGCYEYLGTFASGADLSSADARIRAKAALTRAVELGPTLREPHQALGGMKLDEWDWEGATREFQRARELDPGFAPSRYLVHTGRFDDAVAAARRGAELDPLGYDTQLNLGWTYFMAGRFDESTAQLKKVILLDPGIHHAHYELAWNNAKTGKYREAIAECETALAIVRKRQPEAVTAQGCGWVYAIAGRQREALEIAHHLEKKQAGDDGSIQLAHIYDALGDRTHALAVLSKAYDEHAKALPNQWRSPMVSDELKADPRFQALIRRTGIPWATFPSTQPVQAVVNKPAADQTRR